MAPENIANPRILQVLEDNKTILNGLKVVKMKISIPLTRTVYLLSSVRFR